MKQAMMVVLSSLVLMAAASSPAGDGGGDREALLKADLDFGAASAARGVEGWLSYFAADAAIFPPRGPIVTGLAAIREYYQRVGFSPAGLTWRPVAAVLAESGEVGYTFGYWQMSSVDASGNPSTMRGKYATIWRRTPKGWRVVVDIGNAEPPGPAPAETKPAGEQ